MNTTNSNKEKPLAFLWLGNVWWRNLFLGWLLNFKLCYFIRGIHYKSTLDPAIDITASLDKI